MAWRVVQRRLREALAVSSLTLQAISLILFFIINYLYPIEYKGGLVVAQGALARLEVSGYGIQSITVAKHYSLLISYIILLEAGLIIVQAVAEKSRASRFLGISINLISFNFIALGIAATVRLQNILESYVARYTSLVLADGSTIVAQPLVRSVPRLLLYLTLLVSFVAFVMRGYDWILSEVNAELEELEWEAIIYTLIILGIIAFSISTKIIIVLPHPMAPQKATNIMGPVVMVSASNPWGNITRLEACMDWISKPNVTRGVSSYIVVPPRDALDKAIVYGRPSTLHLWLQGKVLYRTGITGSFYYRVGVSMLLSSPSFQVAFLNNSLVSVSSLNYPLWGVKEIIFIFYKNNNLIKLIVYKNETGSWPVTVEAPPQADHAVVRINFLYHGKQLTLQGHVYKGESKTLQFKP